MGSFGYGLDWLSQYTVERGVSRARNDVLAVVCLGGKAGDLGNRIEWFFPLTFLGQEERKLCWSHYKKAHQSHAIELGLCLALWMPSISQHPGPFMCSGHHPHLLLECPSVFILLIISILAWLLCGTSSYPSWLCFVHIFIHHNYTETRWGLDIQQTPYMHLRVFLNIIILSPWPQATAVVVGSIVVSVLELRKTETQQSGD